MNDNIEALKKEAIDIAEDFENYDNITFSGASRLAKLVRGILLGERVPEEDQED